MDYLAMTKEQLIADNKDKIIYDYHGVAYLYIIHVKDLFDFQRSFIYEMIKDKKLEPKDFGKSRFITIDSIWNVIDQKARKLREDMIRGSLTRLASGTIDKIAKEILQETSSERKIAARKPRSEVSNPIKKVSKKTK